AGSVHGSVLPTFDLDIAYSRSPENLERLASALSELDVTLRGAPDDLPFHPDRRTLEKGMNFTFQTQLGAVDILGEAGGIKSYEELRAASIPTRVEGVDIRVASLDHLIAMKRHANRPKDRLMIEEYLAIADEETRGQSS
ncbi:MAG: hypothetical protein M3M99_00820, partial [Actinomycetota bacterium]|nr:hypothetical protein [Actinomycetota bacterium]